jgi:hypothetical protein
LIQLFANVNPHFCDILRQDIASTWITPLGGFNDSLQFIFKLAKCRQLPQWTKIFNQFGQAMNRLFDPKSF